MPVSLHLSIWENIALGLKPADMTKSEYRVPALRDAQLSASPNLPSASAPDNLVGSGNGFAARACSRQSAEAIVLRMEPLAHWTRKFWRQDTQLNWMVFQESNGHHFRYRYPTTKKKPMTGSSSRGG